MAAIAFALCLCRDIDPQHVYMNFRHLRTRLFNCLEEQSFQSMKFEGSPTEPVGCIYVIEPELYCHCRRPDLKTRMTCCASCIGWFHNDCESGDFDKSTWACRNCREHPDLLTDDDKSLEVNMSDLCYGETNT